MRIEIREESFDNLADYARIPISYSATAKLNLHLNNGVFELEDLEVPFFSKDYDALPENDPTFWPEQFNTTRWGLLAAYDPAGERVGGAALAYGSMEVDMLEGRSDLAVLWDLRVADAARGNGVGKSLWAAAEAWARKRGCIELKVETQHDNVRACRFYHGRGCELVAVDRQAYPEQPDEVQLLWYKTL